MNPVKLILEVGRREPGLEVGGRRVMVLVRDLFEVVDLAAVRQLEVELVSKCIGCI